MALKDILNNAKYADDLVVSLPSGETLTLGEIRTQTSDERKALLDRQALVEQAEMRIFERVNELQAAGLLSDEGHPVKKPSDSAMRREAAAATGLSEDDPLVGEVVKEMKQQLAVRDAKLDSFMQETKNALQTITGVVKTAVQANLDETYAEDFSKAVKNLPKGVEVKYEDAYKFAEESGLKDKYGRFNIAQAVKFMTVDQVIAAERKAARAEGETEAEKKIRLSSISRPSAASPANHRPKTGFNPVEEVKDPKTGKIREFTKSFEQAIAEAQADDDLFASAMNTASFGVIQ